MDSSSAESSGEEDEKLTLDEDEDDEKLTLEEEEEEEDQNDKTKSEKKKDKGTVKPSQFLDDEAELSEDDEEVEFSEDEDADDPKLDEYEKDNFVVDDEEVDEEGKEAAAKEKDRKRKRRRLNEELDDDDLELIGSAPRHSKFKRLKKDEHLSKEKEIERNIFGDDMEDDDGEDLDRLETRTKSESEREFSEDEDEEDEFIVRSEREKEAIRRKREMRSQGREDDFYSTRQIRDVQAVFGDDFSFFPSQQSQFGYDEQEDEYSGDERDTSQVTGEIASVSEAFEPSVLEQNFMTPADEQIKAEDIPERLQARLKDRYVFDFFCFLPFAWPFRPFAPLFFAQILFLSVKPLPTRSSTKKLTG
jgi:transcription elongation factor SPT6